VYAPRGGIGPELGDVEVFAEGDRLHLFHLTLPNHDVVQHVVSDDGLTWRPLPAALRTSDPGDGPDDDMLWTMSVTEREGRYYMLYTALAMAEDGRVQRTALATSDDLVHWTKHPANPVAEADPRWYETLESAPSGRVSWRDPKPILVGDTYYATVNGREKDGPVQRRGCAALIASTDLLSWEVRPPLFAPRRYWDLECPQVFVVDGRYYLTAAIMEDRLQHYWMAERFEGPYTVPPDGGVLAPSGHYAGRVCRWKDMDLFFCWHRADYDWPGIANSVGKFVPSPLVLSRRPDGSLRRSSFPGWSGYCTAPLAGPSVAPTSLFRGRPTEGWRLDGERPGMDVLASAESVGDFRLEGRLLLGPGAQQGGLGFRMDDGGGGYFVELSVGSDEVVLAKWLMPPGRVAYGYRELQRGRRHRPAASGEPIPFKLTVADAYVEVELDGEVVLATLSKERTVGRFGVWAESGPVAADELRWTPLRAPRHG
jgi:beta-fructofuranosidase